MYRLRTLETEAAMLSLCGKEYMACAVDGSVHVIDADVFGLLFEPAGAPPIDWRGTVGEWKAKDDRSNGHAPAVQTVTSGLKRRKSVKAAKKADPPAPVAAPEFRQVASGQSVAQICWNALAEGPMTTRELMDAITAAGREATRDALRLALYKLVARGYLESEDSGDGAACYRRVGQ